MNGPPPLRGYPVDHGLRRSAAARRPRRPGIARRLLAAVARRAEPGRAAHPGAVREPCAGASPR